LPETEERTTARLTGVTDSAPLELARLKATVGGLSLSMMMPVPVPVAIVA